MIMSTWLDRPLTVGGRALVKTEDGIESRLVYLDRDLLVIPSLAIHFQRDINKGHTFNPQVDMQPLWGPAGSRTLTDLVAEYLGVEAADILDSDLQLVTRQAPTQIGPDGEFFMAPRIDDLECAATTLLGFLDASGETDSACAPVWAMFDNEEVGSSSRMGAESSYLRDVLDRILDAVPHSAQASHRAMANSFMLSADNAHATHPNFPQKSDPCAPGAAGRRRGAQVQRQPEVHDERRQRRDLPRHLPEGRRAGAGVHEPRRRGRRQHAGQFAEPHAAHPDGRHRPAPSSRCTVPSRRPASPTPRP